MEQQAFIEKIAGYAVEDAKTSKILPSLTIAQAILESNWGKSGLTAKANNLFGMKGTYNGECVEMPTKEWKNGAYVTINAKFRKYPSWLESVKDHSGLFNRLDRYKNLRGCTDYKLACQYVREDGYATSPTYTSSLIGLIEKYGLQKYDAMMNETPNAGIIGEGSNIGVSTGVGVGVGVGAGDTNENMNNRSRCNVNAQMPLLKTGSTGASVIIWQMIIGTKVDGIFGSDTEDKTKQFQKKKNLVADGIVGSKSWKAGLESM